METSTALTFVTVVFEPELPLLRLQARSLARHLDPDAIAELVVLDNCAGGMGGRAERALRAALGPELGRRCRVLRTAALGVDGAAEGWRSQQAAKLLVARLVRTPHYVVLDAKNHLIAPCRAADLVEDGRARGATHSYAEHPLRAGLERTLGALGADAATIEALVQDFPRTVTPFVLETALVRRMLDDVEARSGEPFAAAFERARALEFFLYSGWAILRGEGVPVDGREIAAPIVWPHDARGGAAAAIAEAEATGAAWFAVHRRALARGAAVRSEAAALWVARGLLTRGEARRLLLGFRLGYAPAVLRARLARRLSARRGAARAQDSVAAAGRRAAEPRP